MSVLAAVALSAEIIKLLLPIVPAIHKVFVDAWGVTNDFETAWGFMAPALPMDARAELKPVMRAVWDTFEDSQLEQAWAALKEKISDGRGITLAEAPDFIDALEHQHQLADDVDGPPTDRQIHEPEPPAFSDGEVSTSVEVPHPGGQS